MKHHNIITIIRYDNGYLLKTVEDDHSDEGIMKTLYDPRDIGKVFTSQTDLFNFLKVNFKIKDAVE